MQKTKSTLFLRSVSRVRDTGKSQWELGPGAQGLLIHRWVFHSYLFKIIMELMKHI